MRENEFAGTTIMDRNMDILEIGLVPESFFPENCDGFSTDLSLQTANTHTPESE